MFVNHTDNMVCLQLHTVRSPHTLHASDPCCLLADAYSCTQYGLHTHYMLLTHAVYLLCLQLHTVQSPYTVHSANPCWWLAVPTAAHSTVSILFALVRFSFDVTCHSLWTVTRCFIDISCGGIQINEVHSRLFLNTGLCSVRHVLF
jgi:hypothetical protein